MIKLKCSSPLITRIHLHVEEQWIHLWTLKYPSCVNNIIGLLTMCKGWLKKDGNQWICLECNCPLDEYYNCLGCDESWTSQICDIHPEAYKKYDTGLQITVDASCYESTFENEQHLSENMLTLMIWCKENYVEVIQKNE